MGTSGQDAVQVLRGTDAVDGLVEEITDPARRQPIVVVTTSTKATGPYLDVEWLADEVEGAARLVVLSSPADPYRLTERLGTQDLAVFGGAARVFPPGTAWATRPHEARLFFCYPGRGRDVAERIADHIRALSYGRPGRAPVPVGASDRHTTATVVNWVSESQVFVRTADGTTCKMLAVDLYPGVPASRLVQPGQHLTGRQRGTGILGDFFPDRVDDQPGARAMEALVDGAVTLARVEQVTGDGVTMVLHPDVPVELLHGDAALPQLFSPGDVVAVEVAWEGSHPFAVLAREEDVGPGLSLLPDGPPWLVSDGSADLAERPADRTVPPLSATPGAPTEEVPETSSLVVLPGLPPAETPQDTILLLAEAEATIALLTDRQGHLEDEVHRLERALRTLQKEHRHTTRPLVHTDPADQFRFEVEFSYLTRVPSGDRAAYPWTDRWRLGSDFLDSMTEVLAGGSISRDKIADVCADVLSGRAQTMRARNVKPWLVSKHGAQLTRADGALAWRVRLQVNSSSARRMKYWVTVDGQIEFDSAGVHDDGL